MIKYVGKSKAGKVQLRQLTPGDTFVYEGKYYLVTNLVNTSGYKTVVNLCTGFYDCLDEFLEVTRVDFHLSEAE